MDDTSSIYGIKRDSRLKTYYNLSETNYPSNVIENDGQFH